MLFVCLSVCLSVGRSVRSVDRSVRLSVCLVCSEVLAARYDQRLHNFEALLWVLGRVWGFRG